MSEVIAIADQYIETWNETDAARRRSQLTQRWAAAAMYCDPLASVAGRAAIEQLIASVQSQFPGYRFARLGAVDSHGRNLRFSWSLTAPDGIVVAKGTDFAVLNAKDQFLTVTGFLDEQSSSTQIN